METHTNKKGRSAPDQRQNAAECLLLRKQYAVVRKVRQGGTYQLGNGRYVAWVTNALSWQPTRRGKAAAYLTLGSFASLRNAQAAIANQLGLWPPGTAIESSMPIVEPNP